jgi:hypothetical protein
MDAIWSYRFSCKVRQVHSYSEEHTHKILILTALSRREIGPTMLRTLNIGMQAWVPDFLHRNGRMGKRLVSLKLHYKTTNLLET